MLGLTTHQKHDSILVYKFDEGENYELPSMPNGHGIYNLYTSHEEISEDTSITPSLATNRETLHSLRLRYL